MIIGFTFNKIAVQRNSHLKGKINVKHDLQLRDVKAQKLTFKEHNTGAAFNFDFIVHYEPKMGSLLINGDVMYYDDEKKVKNVIDTWNKTKKVPQDVSVEVINTILARCNIKALELAEDLNLPAHIPLPKIQIEQEKYSDYIG